MFFADAQARRPRTELPPQTVPFEPTMLVAALATLIKRIGFVATAASTQHELYNLARRFASLDLISQGRVGWNIVASGPPRIGIRNMLKWSGAYGIAGMRTPSSMTRRRVGSSYRKRCTFSIIAASISPSAGR